MSLRSLRETINPERGYQKMETVVTITESDYLAILLWDDEGGAASNVIYRIIPDLKSAVPCTTTRKPPESNNPEQSGSSSLPRSKTVIA
jgi:hypothetical protein